MAVFLILESYAFQRFAIRCMVITMIGFTNFH